MSKNPSKKDEGKKLDVAEAKTPDVSQADEYSTPYEYEDVFGVLRDSRNAGAREFSSADKSKRNVSGKVKSRVIEVIDDSRITTTEALKNSGFDENFSTRNSLSGVWERYDQGFGLRDEPVNFTRLFQQSRLPTNSYIHFRKEKGVIETTGHSGGFFQPPEYSPSSEKLRSDSITKVQSVIWK